MLTAEYLRQVVHYDPETGVFTRDGKVTGSDHPKGYRLITIDGVNYYAHRLAVLYVTGKWPESRISHHSDNQADNRWANIRLPGNTKTPRKRKVANKLGIKGVSRSPNGTYRAQIYVGNRTIYLGIYSTAEAAARTYAQAAHEHFGEFAGPSIAPGALTDFSKQRSDRWFSVAPGRN